MRTRDQVENEYLLIKEHWDVGAIRKERAQKMAALLVIELLLDIRETLKGKPVPSGFEPPTEPLLGRIVSIFENTPQQYPLAK